MNDESVMDRGEFLRYAQSKIERLHNDLLLIEYFDEIEDSLIMLKIFQFITIGIIVVVFFRFNTFKYKEYWKINKIILVTSAILLLGMLVYECLNYKCMSSGFDGVPIGLQLISLCVVLYYYFSKKG